MNMGHWLTFQSSLLSGDFFANVNGLGVVCDDLTFNSVLEGSDNATSVGVVLRVGSEDKLDV